MPVFTSSGRNHDRMECIACWLCNTVGMPEDVRERHGSLATRHMLDGVKVVAFQFATKDRTGHDCRIEHVGQTDVYAIDGRAVDLQRDIEAWQRLAQ